MKFEKGDVCEIVYVRKSNRPGHENYWKPGFMVTVVRCEDGLDPSFNFPYQYVVEHQYGLAYVLADQLRKRRPPEQKSAFSYDQLIQMCNDSTINEVAHG